jgi:hypothetical protein
MTYRLGFALGDRSETLLILLVVGHVLADFLVQTQGVAKRKETSAGALLEHGFWTFATHLAVLAPFMSWTIAAAVAAIALIHTAVDAVRIHLGGEWGKSLAAFFLDQGLHVATVLAAFVILRGHGAQRGILIPYPGVWLGWLRTGAVLFAGYVLNARGGSMVVLKLQQRFPGVVPERKAGEPDTYEMERVIGYLERFLMFTLVILNQWIALGIVVAVRGLRLGTGSEKETVNCYRIIGTLASILVAIATGILVRSVIF